jgi:Ricin-type beta-trefoil lectin domain
LHLSILKDEAIMNRQHLFAFALPILAFACAPQAQAQSFALSNEFTGPNVCLDIVNDGVNNQLTMAPCGNFSGQFWKQRASGNAGYVFLKTDFTGPNVCLDVVNDGRNDRVTMVKCGNFTGQFWRFASTGKPNLFRLTNSFTGKGKCLDVVNDGINNRLHLAKCGNFSGQMWRITED